MLGPFERVSIHLYRFLILFIFYYVRLFNSLTAAFSRLLDPQSSFY